MYRKDCNYMEEEWKYIDGTDNYYEISNLGHIRSYKKVNGLPVPHNLKTFINNKTGYEYFSIFNNNNKITLAVHREVANKFVDNDDRTNKVEVHHKDHNRENNSYTNLAWVTREYNMVESAINTYGYYKDSNGRHIHNRCVDCSMEISYRADRCRSCSSKYKNKTKHATLGTKEVTKESLIKSLTDNKGNFTKSAKEFDMTDNGLRKWCKKFGLPSKSKYWK